MKPYIEQSNFKKILKTAPPLTIKPQYGGVLRIANTYVLPPRMGVPGKINVGSIYVKPIVEALFWLIKQAERYHI